MRPCPKCGEAMAVVQTITVGGLENKDIAWRCERDGVMAELRHPVQYVHVKVGDMDDVDGRRRRLVHKEMRGAELVVYHEWVREGTAAPTGVDRPPGKRPSPRADSASHPAAPKRARTAKSAKQTARTVAAKPAGAAGRAPTAKRQVSTRPPARSKRPRQSGRSRER
jgi:hypothetical protein